MKLSELVVTEKGELREEWMTQVNGCQIVGFVDHVGIDKYKMLHHKIKNLNTLYIKDTNWVREAQGLEKYH